MRKFFDGLVRFVVVVILFAMMYWAFTINTGLKHNQKIEGKTTQVSWEYVNVRKGYDVGTEKLGMLFRHDFVTLTGNTYTYGGDLNETSYWAEIQWDNGTAWIVSASLKEFP